MSGAPMIPSRRPRPIEARRGPNWLGGAGRIVAKQAKSSRQEPNSEESRSCTMDPLADRLDVLERFVHDVNAKFGIWCFQPGPARDPPEIVGAFSNKLGSLESSVLSINKHFGLFYKSKEDFETFLPHLLESGAIKFVGHLKPREKLREKTLEDLMVKLQSLEEYNLCLSSVLREL